jgi:hypothetical protein
MDGTCTEIIEELCEGYEFHPETPCEPWPCQLVGACCYDNQLCVFALEGDCYANYDWYEFLPFEPCEPNPCPPPVPVEETTWGSIKADYR